MKNFIQANTGHLVKLLNDLMKEVKKITGTTKVNAHNSTDNVAEDSGTSVKTETTPPSVCKKLKNTKTSTTNDLRAFVRDNYYRDMKFSGSDKEQETLLPDAIKSGGLQVPIGVTKNNLETTLYLK